MVKIALIAPTHLPARRANTIQVMKMAQAIQTVGHQVRVLVPGPPPGDAGAWEALAQHYGLQDRFDVCWIPVQPAWRSYDFGFRAIREASRWGAEVLYTRLPQAAALASWMGKAVIFEVHDLPGGVLGPWLFRLFLKGSGARRLVVITASLREALARAVAPLPPYPFTLVAPDGVDLARYEDLPESGEARQLLQLPALGVERFTLGYTGHLYPGRGVALILDLAAHFPQMNFLLVGGEPSSVESLRRQARDRKLNNVVLTGFVPNAELPRYQAACDVLLMPYQSQVTGSSGGDIAPFLSPMKVFEYLACGRVILSSDLPVLREVLHPQNAILLPPADRAAWIAAVEAVYRDPGLRGRLAAQARQEAQNYTWTARAARIFNEEV